MPWDKDIIVTGGDPRPFTEYQTLAQEMAKQQHPARPDIDWQLVEQMALRLFKQHGVDLQSVAWYCLARAHRQQLSGVLEGMQLLQALLAYQWSRVWPEKLSLRLAVLLSLAKQLQQLLRVWHYHPADVTDLQALQQSVTALLAQLNRHSDTEPTELSALVKQIDNILAALAQRGYLNANPPATLSDQPQPLAVQATSQTTPLIFVAKEEADSSLLNHRWQAKKAFLAGMFAMALLVGMGYSVQRYYQAPSLQKTLLATVAPLPQVLPVAKQQQWQTEHASQLTRLARYLLPATQRQLTALQTLPLLWKEQYSWQLLQQTARFWPDKAKAWQAKWQQNLQANQFTLEELSAWQRSQQRLAHLMQQLNQADNHPRRYLTVSQLKSSLFAISEPLTANQPVEELLRQLAQQQQQGQVSPRLTKQIDDKINKIMNSYFLLSTPLGSSH